LAGGAGRSGTDEMAEYVVGKLNEIPEGKAIAVEAGRRTIAVFRVGGKLYAIANRCPHKGASPTREIK
jgi:nitrite reductase/ring-hydroxylating ferredoxin subunit